MKRRSGQSPARLRATPGVAGLHDLKTRKAGDLVLVDYLLDKKRTPLDSATVENGAFRIKGVADTPSVAYLADARDMQGTFATMVILEPGTITVADNAENPQFKLVSGTVSNDANKAYSEAGMALTKEYRNPETSDERRSAIEKEYEALTDKASSRPSTSRRNAPLAAVLRHGRAGVARH